MPALVSERFYSTVSNVEYVASITGNVRRTAIHHHALW